MKLHELAPKIPKKSKLRRGQGNATGNGTFAGRGCKGQGQRSGKGLRPTFEGGQTPLVQKMPKFRGFSNPNKIIAQIVKLSDLEVSFENGEIVSLETLLTKKLISPKNAKVKILGEGELTKKLTVVSGIFVSASAIAAITKAGGKVEEPQKEKTSKMSRGVKKVEKIAKKK